jgi:hydroxypyruvate isomerase
VPRICVCIEPLFPELSLAERAAKVADAGFDTIEFWFYDMGGDRGIDALAEVCRQRGITINNTVVNSPDGAIGGSLVAPADRDKYLARLRETIPVARKLGARMLITCTGNTLPNVPREQQRQSIVDTLSAAAPIAAEAGITLVLEALNGLVDHQGYFLDSPDEAASIIREIGQPNVKYLYDVYHMQIMSGNVIATIQRDIDAIGHFHSAGVPGRHELSDGELNYPNILKAIDSFGYQGCFGLEYWPLGDHQESLRAMRALTR